MSSTGATPPLGSESIGPTLKMTAKYLNRPNERDFVTSTMTAGQTLPAATPAAQPKVIFREGSLRRNFSWTLVGNIVYSAVLWGVIGLTLARAAVLLGHDITKRTQLLPREITSKAEAEELLRTDAAGFLRPRWTVGAQSELFRTSISLGVIAMLVSLLPNIPRYFLVGKMGERALGIFTATAFLVSTGNLIMQAMGQAAFVRLAKLYGARDLAGLGHGVLLLRVRRNALKEQPAVALAS